MNAWQEVALIFGMMVVTFGVRYSVLALSGRIQLPAALEEALRFVPVAVLTALCFPIMFMPEGQFFISLNNAHLIASMVAIAVAAYSRHLLLTIVVGMGLFLFLHLR